MHGGTVIAGKVGYAVGCVVAASILMVSGYAYHVESQLSGIASSPVAAGGPQTGAMNILLMGLESRTDYNGNVLSSGLLTAMHAGSVYGVKYQGVGGQATNTLILIHIFAGVKKAVGISIPRDDWVTFPKPYYGQSQGKIDQVYGLAYAQSLNETVNSSMSHDERYLKANEAGRNHVEETIKRAHCALDTATDRRGRPYSLVCTKNQASYERRVQQRKKDLANFKRLDV